MQSISDKKLTIIRNTLIIINIIIIITFIFLYIRLNTTLSYNIIQKEIKSTFGKEYELVPYDLNNRTILISAITTNKIDIDYDTRIDTLINNLNKYKPNKYLDRLILRFEYEEGNSKYIQKEYELNTLKFH